MGREVRRVPKDWQHPKRNGRYIPLLGHSFEEAAADWDEGGAQWAKGLKRDYGTDGWKSHDEESSYEDWAGRRPSADEYMPAWPESERTHLQMYEDTSEGTPISPVMETPEQLARWLADSGASSFGPMTATYEQWLATIHAGSAISAVFTPATGLISGVEAMDVLGETPTKGETP